MQSSYTIPINSKGYDYASGKYTYTFTTAQDLRGKKVGLASINMYNSFYNITPTYYNNQVSFTFQNMTVVITIPDGYYDIPALNYYFQQICLEYGFYCVDSSDNLPVFFFSITENNQRYSAEMMFFLVQNSKSGTLSVGTPLNSSYVGKYNWELPAYDSDGTITPSIYWNNKFGDLIGFITKTTYPTNNTIDSQIISTITPNLNIVSSIILLCNLINNQGISNPTNVLASFAITSSFGSYISGMNNMQVLYSFVSGNTTSVSEITIQMTDQNGNLLLYPTHIKDNDLLMILVINS